MAVCNVFKKLTKETGTFLTFSQYMEDLTEWQIKSKYHRIVPSKFIAIDCQSTNYNNLTLPKLFQEHFENACACFKNQLSDESAEFDDVDPMAIPMTWSAEYSKTLFWNMMLNDSDSMDDTNSEVTRNGLISIEDIKYVGDINLQSYNTTDGTGYSEIYCHIPNEARASLYSYNYEKLNNTTQVIERNVGDVIEGFQANELDGWETLSIRDKSNDDSDNSHVYKLDKHYEFSWEDTSINTSQLADKSFNINMIVVLYDIWNDHNVICSNIPLGVYITGLIDDYGVIQNSITKYVSNEDIYNSGTSYGLRICSRYVVSPNDDNYIVKEVTCEDNNYGELSRVLSQLSISQNKMDEVINKTYNTEQNYKNLLSIFKNSRTNVPYIKIINDESCWFVNGKLIGPSVVDGIYDAYTDDEIEVLLDSNRNQSFQIIATATDINGNQLFDSTNPFAQKIILKWDVYYEGKKVSPKFLTVNEQDLTNTNQLIYTDINQTTVFKIYALYGQLETVTSVIVHFVPPIYFGEVNSADPSNTDITNIKKYLATTADQIYEISTNSINPGYVCYAYPAEFTSAGIEYQFNKLNTIVDGQGYIYYDNHREGVDEEDNSFRHKTMDINGINYHVYISKTPAHLDKQMFKFKTQKSLTV